ncbi:MAG: alpha/beta hydrolase-fold protein [Planctomycetota bacterium]
MTLTRLAAFVLAAAPLFAQAQERAPDAAAKGKVYQWKSKDGLAYEYYLPKDFDAGRPINLTFVLHGSNLDRRWGFANHKAGEFRADDLVVCPDGTTSNGQNGFNSLQSPKDLERLHALHAELKGLFDVRATYVYGHSQGSFFALYYAGAYPDEVQGVVAQASGCWIGTAMSKKHHHQAIVLMHGTADPVVPYGQSIGALDAYREAKYPHVRLRSLEGWNHWPAQAQTEQELAWCEGLTTADPVRLAAAFATLAAVKEGADPVALREVAVRVQATDGIDAAVKKDAAAAVEAVDAAAREHADAIGKSAGKDKKLADKPWVGHLPRFLRLFGGTPVGDEVAAAWKGVLDKQQDAVKKYARDFWQDKDGKPKEAFAAGVQLVAEAFLTSASENEEILGALEGWAKDGKKVGLGKGDLKAFEQSVPVVRAARDKGQKAFEKVGRRFR